MNIILLEFKELKVQMYMNNNNIVKHIYRNCFKECIKGILWAEPSWKALLDLNACHVSTSMLNLQLRF